MKMPQLLRSSHFVAFSGIPEFRIPFFVFSNDWNKHGKNFQWLEKTYK